MKKFFIDNIFVMTDYMGGWSDQCREIGWYDKNSNAYFSLEEVREIFEKGDALNVGKREDGSLYMEHCWCDYRQAFTIVCGIPFGDYEKHSNLLSYAKKIGWVTEEPMPIEMFSGIKNLSKNEDDTYNITYSINKEKNKGYSKDFIKKICVGSMLRLKNSTLSVYDTNGNKKENPIFSCGDIEFDEEELILTINNIPKKEMNKRVLIDYLRDLDLELLLTNPRFVNFSNVLSAGYDICRDKGQYHWIGEETERDEKKSNIYWYNKFFKED